METNKKLAPLPCPPPQAEEVMTDEQMEVLRKQIAAYAAISGQLEELHRALSHNDDLLAGGVRTGILCSNSYMESSSRQKLSRRQRWNPTPEQLRVLELVFEREGIKTPNPQKVKEITAELAHHGQITEPNVYNWFQNRRARLKKKLMLEAETNSDQSEAEMVRESFDAKGPNLRNEGFCQENAVDRTAIAPLHCVQGCPKPSVDLAKMPIHGRMSWEESHNPLLKTENCNNTGDTWWPKIS